MFQRTTITVSADRTRLAQLRDAAYNVRQRAISTGGDLEGWRLARLMRDAQSSSQLNVAERWFGRWFLTRTRDVGRTA